MKKWKIGMLLQETELKLKRGDIYWVNLDPTIGSEIKKKRPCVLIGATPINEARRTVVVVPLSGSGKAHPPLAVEVACLGRVVVAVCDQIRAVDKSRLLENAGALCAEDIQKIEVGLKTVLYIG